jgi:hypothetical protein
MIGNRPSGGAALRPRWVTVLACALVALVAAATARAHGDPASHYLETESLYPAFADRPSQRSELRLLGLLQAAERRGYPIKVALVANADDLTDNPRLLRHPQRYAEFVASELGDGLDAPVLVVTPHGLGAAGRPPTRLDGLMLLRNIALPRRAGGDALAAAAMVAVRKLAQSDGHPLPAQVPPAQVLGAGIAAGGNASDDGGTGGWLTAGVLTLALVGALLALGARSLR